MKFYILSFLWALALSSNVDKFPPILKIGMNGKDVIRLLEDPDSFVPGISTPPAFGAFFGDGFSGEFPAPLYNLDFSRVFSFNMNLNTILILFPKVVIDNMQTADDIWLLNAMLQMDHYLDLLLVFETENRENVLKLLNDRAEVMKNIKKNIPHKVSIIEILEACPSYRVQSFIKAQAKSLGGYKYDDPVSISLYLDRINEFGDLPYVKPTKFFNLKCSAIAIMATRLQDPEVCESEKQLWFTLLLDNSLLMNKERMNMCLLSALQAKRFNELAIFQYAVKPNHWAWARKMAGLSLKDLPLFLKDICTTRRLCKCNKPLEIITSDFYKFIKIRLMDILKAKYYLLNQSEEIEHFAAKGRIWEFLPSKNEFLQLAVYFGISSVIFEGRENPMESLLPGFTRLLKSDFLLTVLDQEIAKLVPPEDISVILDNSKLYGIHIQHTDFSFPKQEEVFKVLIRFMFHVSRNVRTLTLMLVENSERMSRFRAPAVQQYETSKNPLVSFTNISKTIVGYTNAGNFFQIDFKEPDFRHVVGILTLPKELKLIAVEGILGLSIDNRVRPPPSLINVRKLYGKESETLVMKSCDKLIIDDLIANKELAALIKVDTDVYGMVLLSLIPRCVSSEYGISQIVRFFQTFPMSKGSELKPIFEALFSAMFALAPSTTFRNVIGLYDLVAVPFDIRVPLTFLTRQRRLEWYEFLKSINKSLAYQFILGTRLTFENTKASYAALNYFAGDSKFSPSEMDLAEGVADLILTAFHGTESNAVLPADFLDAILTPGSKHFDFYADLVWRVRYFLNRNCPLNLGMPKDMRAVLFRLSTETIPTYRLHEDLDRWFGPSKRRLLDLQSHRKNLAFNRRRVILSNNWDDLRRKKSNSKSKPQPVESKKKIKKSELSEDVSPPKIKVAKPISELADNISELVESPASKIVSEFVEEIVSETVVEAPKVTAIDMATPNHSFSAVIHDVYETAIIKKADTGIYIDISQDSQDDEIKEDAIKERKEKPELLLSPDSKLTYEILREYAQTNLNGEVTLKPSAPLVLTQIFSNTKRFPFKFDPKSIILKQIRASKKKYAAISSKNLIDILWQPTCVPIKFVIKDAKLKNVKFDRKQFLQLTCFLKDLPKHRLARLQSLIYFSSGMKTWTLTFVVDPSVKSYQLREGVIRVPTLPASASELSHCVKPLTDPDREDFEEKNKREWKPIEKRPESAKKPTLPELNINRKIQKPFKPNLVFTSPSPRPAPKPATSFLPSSSTKPVNPQFSLSLLPKVSSEPKFPASNILDFSKPLNLNVKALEFIPPKKQSAIEKLKESASKIRLVTAENFKNELFEFKGLLQNGNVKYISFDCEMTGVYLDGHDDFSINNTLKVHMGVQRFRTFQIGITAKKTDGDFVTWSIFCTPDLNVLEFAQKSLKFLFARHLPKDTVQEHVERLATREIASIRRKSVTPDCGNEFVQLLFHFPNVPLVVHSGFIDFLHLFKINGRSYSLEHRQVVKQLQKDVYDTKEIGIIAFPQLTYDCSLLNLFGRLEKCALEESMLHDAAYDSLVTAFVFDALSRDYLGTTELNKNVLWSFDS